MFNSRSVKMIRFASRNTVFPKSKNANNLLHWNFASISSASAKEQCPMSENPTPPQSTIDSDEFKDAKPATQIPGPSTIPIFGMMHHFFPGGKFYNVKMTDLHLKLREEFGDIVRLPGIMGRPDLVVVYDPDNFSKLYRNEGEYPHRRSFAVFEYFRKHERPDLFKGKAGLLSE